MSSQLRGDADTRSGEDSIRGQKSIKSRPSSGDRQDGSSSVYHDDEEEASVTLQLDMEETEYSKTPLRRKALWGLGCGVCLLILALLISLNLLLFAATSLYSSAILPSEFVRSTVPIPCHSHNDYWRKVPVFSALHVGCIGIEADVWATDDDLYVGHDIASLRPNRTFTSLYIEPLTRILQQQNTLNGSLLSPPQGIYDTNPSQTLILLIDLKTGAEDTWPRVLRQLQPLREKGWLSYVEDGVVNMGPITVVGSGNSKFRMVTANATYRDTFFDAPLAQLENSPYDATNSYYSSVSFKHSIGIVRFGRLSGGQIQKIRGHVAEAHSRGLKARYWELPAWPVSTRNYVWEVLRKEGVDILNVDDLSAARDFLDHPESSSTSAPER